MKKYLRSYGPSSASIKRFCPMCSMAQKWALLLQSEPTLPTPPPQVEPPRLQGEPPWLKSELYCYRVSLRFHLPPPRVSSMAPGLTQWLKSELHGSRLILHGSRVSFHGSMCLQGSRVSFRVSVVILHGFRLNPTAPGWASMAPLWATWLQSVNGSRVLMAPEWASVTIGLVSMTPGEIHCSSVELLFFIIHNSILE